MTKRDMSDKTRYEFFYCYRFIYICIVCYTKNTNQKEFLEKEREREKKMPFIYGDFLQSYNILFSYTLCAHIIYFFSYTLCALFFVVLFLFFLFLFFRFYIVRVKIYARLLGVPCSDRLLSVEAQYVTFLRS